MSSKLRKKIPMTVYLVINSKGTMGQFIHSWLLTLKAFVVVETLGGFSNRLGKNLSGKKTIKESQTGTSQSQGVYIRALTCNSFLENSGKNKVFSSCCENKPQDPINDGARNGMETFVWLVKQASGQLM